MNKIIILSVLSSSIWAMQLGSDIQKFCNYSKLSKIEKDKLVVHAYNTYLPAEYKKSLSTGINNYSVATQSHLKQRINHCRKSESNKGSKKICDSALRKNDTFLKYDVKTAYDAINSYVASQRGLIQRLNALCPNFSDEIAQIQKDYDPTKIIESKQSLVLRQSEVHNIARIFGMNLTQKRIHNPKVKKDANPSQGIFNAVEVGKNCKKGEVIELSFLDSLQLNAVEYIQSIMDTFSPNPPSKIVTKK